MTSRLIVNSIRHTGASTDALTLDSSGNITCNGTATGFGGGGGATGIDFNDDTKIRFGGSNQLEVFYGNSIGNVKVTSGNLNLISSGGVVTKVNTSEDAVVCNANSSVDLYHNGTKRVETTAEGLAIFSTTSPTTSATSSGDELVISGDGVTGMTIHTNSSSSSSNIFFSDPDDNNVGSIRYLHNNNQIRLLLNGNGTPVMQFNSNLTIYFNGNMYSNGNSYSTGSDLRMKSNLVQFTNPLDDLKKLTGYKFDIKNTNTGETRKSAGLIAQDVEKVYPEFVDENPETGMKSLEYNTFIGVLVEAVKELTTRVETLESS
tara:strand:- start:799 stop:1752 length:954 start_codon:yes stop_codon:yes gene_type:complete